MKSRPITYLADRKIEEINLRMLSYCEFLRELHVLKQQVTMSPDLRCRVKTQKALSRIAELSKSTDVDFFDGVSAIEKDKLRELFRG